MDLSFRGVKFDMKEIKKLADMLQAKMQAKEM